MGKHKIKYSQIAKMRNSLGLTTTAFANRLGVQQSTALRLEQSEARGSISLASLEKAAEALGCVLNYSLTSIDKIPNKKEKKVRQTNQLQESNLGSEMKVQDLEQARNLSAEVRMKRALRLSDLIRKLQNV